MIKVNKYQDCGLIEILCDSDITFCSLEDIRNLISDILVKNPIAKIRIVLTNPYPDMFIPLLDKAKLGYEIENLNKKINEIYSILTEEGK